MDFDLSRAAGSHGKDGPRNYPMTDVYCFLYLKFDART